jgi:hypothetical protein
MNTTATTYLDTVIVSGDWLYDGSRYTEAFASAVHPERRRWNGWAVPYVTRTVADRIVKMQQAITADGCGGERLKWNGDTLIFEGDDFDPQAVEQDAEGRYLLDFGWCWDEVTADTDALGDVVRSDVINGCSVIHEANGCKVIRHPTGFMVYGNGPRLGTYRTLAGAKRRCER